MKPSLLFSTAILALAGALAPFTPAQAQYYSQSRYSGASTRHCQTDYDHRPHTYQTYSGVYFCPGGAHQHYGSSYRSYSYRGRRVRDPMVAQVQAILVQKDIYHHRHHNQVDGIYGEETRHAVEDFQKLSGLPATGMLDAQTLEALGIMGVGEGQAPPAASSAGPQAPVNGNARATAPAPPPVNELPKRKADEVLTPADVAQLLQVSEADVIALLESNELIGRKIGAHWRIMRSAVDDFFSESDDDDDGHDHDHENDHDHKHDDDAGGEKGEGAPKQ